MVNVICTKESWGELMGLIPEVERFTAKSEYVQELVDKAGWPLYVEFQGSRGPIRMHIYPPQKGL